MKTLHYSFFSILWAFLFVAGIISACETEAKKSEQSPSKTSDEKVENVEVDMPTEHEPSQALNNLKTKDVIYAWVDKLNVRDDASLESKAIAKVDGDAALEFTGVKSGDVETVVLRGVAYEDLWYKVVTEDGKEGWVFGGAVKRQTESKGNPLISDTKFAFPHFGGFDLSTWKKLGTQSEGEEVDREITSYQKGDQILEITASDMGEMYYGYDYTLRDKDGNTIKERSFSFNGDTKLLEEKVKDYITHTEYVRTQNLKKHWYQLNAKPVMANGEWTERPFN